MNYTISRRMRWIFFIVQLFVMSFSCKTPQRYIVNHWKVEKFQPGVDFSASPRHMEVFRDFQEHAQFDFNSDGTYFFEFPGNIQKGKWIFDRRKMQLTTTDENGNTTVSKVLELKPGKLTLEQDDKGVKHLITLVPKVKSQ